MDILLPKLLSQTLGQGPDSMLCRAKRAGNDITSDTSCSTSEDQSAFASLLVVRTLFKLLDRLLSKSPRREIVRVHSFGHFFSSDLQKGFPNSMACVEQSCLVVVFWGWEFSRN